MKHKGFIIVFAVIICLCTALTLFAFCRKDAAVAEVYADGERLMTIRLSEVTEPYTLPIERNGHKNVLLVENGAVSMTEADCPDRLCVKQGAIRSSSFPIVCLPNGVVIKIRNGAESDSPDAVSR